MLGFGWQAQHQEMSTAAGPTTGRPRAEPLAASAEGTASGPDGSGTVPSLRSAGSVRGDGLPLGTASERCEVLFMVHFWWAQRVRPARRPAYGHPLL